MERILCAGEEYSDGCIRPTIKSGPSNWGAIDYLGHSLLCLRSEGRMTGAKYADPVLKDRLKSCVQQFAEATGWQ